VISGRAPSRINTLLGSLPIHPSSVSGRYHLCVLFPHPTLLASRVRYGKRYEAWLLSRKWPQARKAPLDYNPLALLVALVEPRLGTGAPPLNSLCLSPKALLWRVTAGMVRQEVYDESSKGVEQR
jgi:hypothetical protein